MKISIIGSGYVGLVTGACFAERGHEVLCVDIEKNKTDLINQGISPIYEHKLDELLQKNVPARLRATTDLLHSVLATEVSLIAVGTPFQDGDIDLTFVRAAAISIGQALSRKKAYHVVSVKSTVLPGTTEKVVLPILEETSGKKAGTDFGVATNPEFLREGAAVDDFMNPDRIVLGGIDARSLRMMEEVYKIFPGVELVRSSPRTAEMIKYTCNSLLATLISFSNEIANLCSASGGIDVVEVMKGVLLDRRISPIQAEGTRVVPGLTTYLEAGCGFGGSCFPKDVRALIAQGRKLGRSMELLASVIQVNDEQPQQVISLLKKHYPQVNGLRVAILGLAFKPGTDDMRESPSLPVIRHLLAKGAYIRAFDPCANGTAQKILGNHRVVYCESLEESVAEVEAVILMTRWKEFERIPALLADRDPKPLLIDGRRMLARDSVARYEGIGL